MLSLNSNARIFLYQDPISMRKSFEGLTVAVEEMFPGNLFSNAYFIFLNRKRDLIKVLYWDGDGFVIWYKRLEKGSFSRKNKTSCFLERKDFLMLLEGVIPKRINMRYSKKY